MSETGQHCIGEKNRAMRQHGFSQAIMLPHPRRKAEVGSGEAEQTPEQPRACKEPKRKEGIKIKICTTKGDLSRSPSTATMFVAT